MKVLLIGSGGREHAMAWKLAQSPQVTRMWCAPGNAGIAQERLSTNGSIIECVPIGAEDLDALEHFATEVKADLTVVGPDNPLALGIVDRLQQAGLRIWGPNRRAARFESSKVFSQEFMQRHGIPTAAAESFTDPERAHQFAQSLGGRCAVKADGLALGKGVTVCRNREQAAQAIDRTMRDKVFGDAGSAIVIQELLEGREASLHALCDGQTYSLFPSSQDHKPAFDGDLGPNTGGMGTYSPVPFLPDDALQEVAQRVLDPWLRGCQQEGIDYCGLFYPGIMLTDEGPKVIEFNARFGDPETQVYLTRLENDLVDLLQACIDRKLENIPLSWRNEPAVCVVVASGGYPNNYSRGKVISGLKEAGARPDTKVFHAGTAIRDGQTVTNGGRVLGITSWAPSLEEARQMAYQGVRLIKFEGAFYRRDIAKSAD